MGEKLRLPMDDSKLDDSELELLRALRGSPDSRLDELADAVGLPRTNFGRPLSGRIQGPISDLVADGLVEDHQGRYRLSPDGRRTVVERAGGRTR
jgi:DNA-binding IclR family transcriptional regulator